MIMQGSSADVTARISSAWRGHRVVPPDVAPGAPGDLAAGRRRTRQRYRRHAAMASSASPSAARAAAPAEAVGGDEDACFAVARGARRRRPHRTRRTSACRSAPTCRRRGSRSPPPATSGGRCRRGRPSDAEGGQGIRPDGSFRQQLPVGQLRDLRRRPLPRRRPALAPAAGLDMPIQAVVGEVEPAARKPAGPPDAAGVVQHSRVRRRPPDAEISLRRRRIPLEVGHGAALELGQRGDPVGAHEAADPRALDGVEGGAPDDVTGFDRHRTVLMIPPLPPR